MRDLSRANKESREHAGTELEQTEGWSLVQREMEVQLWKSEVDGDVLSSKCVECYGCGRIFFWSFFLFWFVVPDFVNHKGSFDLGFDLYRFCPDSRLLGGTIGQQFVFVVHYLAFEVGDLLFIETKSIWKEQERSNPQAGLGWKHQMEGVLATVQAWRLLQLLSVPLTPIGRRQVRKFLQLELVQGLIQLCCSRLGLPPKTSTAQRFCE